MEDGRAWLIPVQIQSLGSRLIKVEMLHNSCVYALGAGPTRMEGNQVTTAAGEEKDKLE